MNTLLKKFNIILMIAIINTSFIYGQKKIIHISFSQDDFKSITKDGYTRIAFKGFDYYYKENLGAPALPYYLINLSVPDGARFLNVEYNYETELFADNITIQPTQHLIPTNKHDTLPPKVEPLSSIYGSPVPFPENITQYTSTQLMSQYRFFTFEISPFIYYPLQKKLFIIKSIQISVIYDLTDYRDTYRWDNGTFYNFLKDQIINPSDLNLSKSPKNINDVEYLIITSSALSSYFQPLANWKTQKGVPAEIITTEFIYANYSGTTEQLKIKNCISDYYQNKGTIWVLLGGDNTVVPDQDAYGNVEDYYVDNTMPTDLFYACFDNQFNWNADGDGIYGELTDNIDMAPEVFIARAPVRTSAHTTAFVNKVLNYEQNPPAADFEKKMVLSGIQLFDYVGSQSDIDYQGELMWNGNIAPYWNGTHYRLYDTNTDFGGSTYDVTNTHVSNQINNGYNFFFMGTHGDQQLWAMEDGYYFSSSDASALTNLNEQGIIVSISCLTNAFDDSYAPADPCLSEAFIRNANGGAVAYHASSRYGWGDYDPTIFGPSMQYSAYFYEYMFSGQPAAYKYKFGSVSAQGKIQFIGSSMGYTAMRWLQFAINPIGDPEMDIFTDDPQTITATTIDTIPCGATSLTITSASPADAFAALYNNGHLVATTQLSGGSGTLNFNPIPNFGVDAILTLTEHNYTPYIIQIPISDSCDLPPVAVFEIINTTNCFGTQVTINDLSYFNPVTWQWSFTPNTVTYVNGTNQNSPEPDVQFNSLGTYSVSLIVTNSYGSDTLTKINYVTIIAIEADFTADQTNCVVGNTVNFTDLSLCSPTSWQWNFTPNTITYVNSTNANSQNPKVQFNATGVYTVSLITSNAYGSDTLIKTNYITVVNSYNMCSSSTTTSQSGILYDSGGQTGNYNDNENCSFLINPGCAISITLSFNSFQVEDYYDYLYVYDGIDASGTLLLNATGSYTIPSPVTATSGAMYIVFTSDYSYTMSGFEAHWASTIPSVPPIADFNISDTNPPLNTGVLFTDQTANYPSSWLWNFGDGFTSIEQNPTHAYSIQGTYNVTLIVNNCLGADTIIKTLTVQGPPLIAVVPTSFNVSLAACGDSVSQTITIYNNGVGELSYELTIDSITGTNPEGIIYDDFEDGNYNDWLMGSGSYTAQVVASDPGNGSYSLQLTGGNYSFGDGLYQTFTPDTVSYISVYMKPSSTLYYHNFFSVGDNNIYSNYGIIYMYFEGTTLGLYTYSQSITLPCNLNQWYHIEFKNINFSTKTFDFYVDNVLIQSNFPFCSQTSVNVSQVHLFNYDYATAYYDDVIIGEPLSDLWVTYQPDTGTVPVADTSIINILFNSTGLNGGTYYADLIVNSNDPLNPQISIPCTLNVSYNPCADFEYSLSGCSGIVGFTDNSLNAPISWMWNFGDGSTSSQQNPTHTYTSTGTYNIQLIICNAYGCDTATHSITLTNINGPVPASCTPQTNSPYTYIGIFNVIFNTINNSTGSGDDYQDYSCTDWTTVTVGNTYTLSVQTGYSYNENVRAWIDYNNNGSFQTSEMILDSYNNVYHSANVTISGTAVVNTPLRMRIGSDYYSMPSPETCTNVEYGQFEDYTVILQPNTLPPIALFTNNILDVCQGVVQFIDQTNNTPTSWLWDFGDGTTSSYQNPYHQYLSAGVYIVTLSVTNQYGSDSYATTLLINSLNPQIIINGNAYVDSTLYFTALNTTGVISWHWDFGDGYSANLQSPYHIYTAMGGYTVSLTVTNDAGCTAQTLLYIYIDEQVDINKYTTFNSIRIYPNPSRDNIFIDFPTNFKLSYITTLTISDINGRQLLKQNIKQSNLTIYIGNLSSGIYIVKVCNEKEVFVSRLIKQ